MPTKRFAHLLEASRQNVVFGSVCIYLGKLRCKILVELSPARLESCSQQLLLVAICAHDAAHPIFLIARRLIFGIDVFLGDPHKSLQLLILGGFFKFSKNQLLECVRGHYGFLIACNTVVFAHFMTVLMESLTMTHKDT